MKALQVKIRNGNHFITTDPKKMKLYQMLADNSTRIPIATKKLEV